MSKGAFFAVGVGPGDPLELTLRAKKTLESAEVIVIPVKEPGAVSAAYTIAAQAADMEQAEKLEVVFPMRASADYRSYLQGDVLSPVCAALEAGKQVAMVTLGDVSVYSTATYVRQELEEQGYETYVVPGIAAYSAGAALAGQSLCENDESLLIMPGVTDRAAIEQALAQFENLVIMKAGRALSWLIPMLEEKKLLCHTTMLQNIGMKDAYIGPPRLGDPSYFTTLLIKRGGTRT